MSSEENKKIKEDKKQIDLNSSKLKKEKSQKETDNMPQKKNRGAISILNNGLSTKSRFDKSRNSILFK